jgi:hypothetical protein
MITISEAREGKDLYYRRAKFNKHQLLAKKKILADAVKTYLII